MIVDCHTHLWRYPGEITEHVENPYVSADEDAMTREELKKYLLENKVFENLEV